MSVVVATDDAERAGDPARAATAVRGKLFCVSAILPPAGDLNTARGPACSPSLYERQRRRIGRKPRRADAYAIAAGLRNRGHRKRLLSEQRRRRQRTTRGQPFDRLEEDRYQYGLGDEGRASQCVRQVFLVVTADHHIRDATCVEAGGQVCRRAVDELGIENDRINGPGFDLLQR